MHEASCQEAEQSVEKKHRSDRAVAGLHDLKGASVDAPKATADADVAAARGAQDLLFSPVKETPPLDRSGASGDFAGLHHASSDEQPKRKRLGWGQGLARLKSVDTRPKGTDTAHPESSHPCHVLQRADVMIRR